LIGGYSEVLIVGAFLGQMKLTKPQAPTPANCSRFPGAMPRFTLLCRTDPASVVAR
jgi:hypothetical protein